MLSKLLMTFLRLPLTFGLCEPKCGPKDLRFLGLSLRNFPSYAFVKPVMPPAIQPKPRKAQGECARVLEAARRVQSEPWKRKASTAGALEAEGECGRSPGSRKASTAVALEGARRV